MANDRPDASQKKRRRCFVIVTTMRSGSTLLVRSLDSSADIFCAGELFHIGKEIHHPEFQFPHYVTGQGRIAKVINACFSEHRVRRHLGAFFADAGVGTEAVGFKVMVSQIRKLPVIIPALIEQGARFIFLYRQNSVAAALSYCKAKASGVFHSDRFKRTAERREIAIDEAEFERVLGICKRDKEWILHAQKVHGGYLLAYEDVVADWDRLIGEIGIHIGIDGLHVEKALAKLDSSIGTVHVVNEMLLRESFGDEVTIGKRN